VADWYIVMDSPSVCLALAQQLTIKKALADGMKQGIVAKLSAEVHLPSLFRFVLSAIGVCELAQIVLTPPCIAGVPHV
jgi:hypothetical protein